MSADVRKLRGSVAIVGVGESDELGKLPHKSSLQLHIEATHNALADAGLRKQDVDAVFTSGRNMANDVPEYLGIRPRFIGGTQVGGCSFILHVEHAMAAINAGLCEVALITHGESGPSPTAIPAPRSAGASTTTHTPHSRLCTRRPRPPARLGPPPPPPYARVRHHQAPDGRGRGGHAQVGGAQSEGLRTRSDHDRRRARLAADRLAVQSARLLPGD